jgi:hypothetical protein
MLVTIYIIIQCHNPDGINLNFHYYETSNLMYQGVFLIVKTKVFWKDNNSQLLRESLQNRWEHWQRYQEMVFRNSSKRFVTTSKSMLLELLWSKCCVNRCKVTYFYVINEMGTFWSYVYSASALVQNLAIVMSILTEVSDDFFQLLQTNALGEYQISSRPCSSTL